MAQNPRAETSLQATMHPRIADIGDAAWNACAGPDNPFVSYEFLSALEESGSVGGQTGWLPHYLSLRNARGAIDVVAPLYLKLHSYGEYVFDQGWADAFERAGGSYYPKLQICVPFSPVPGPRLLRRAGSAVSGAEIAEALQRICGRLGVSSLHATFCTRQEAEEMAAAGWLSRLGVQYHWHNQAYAGFDDFLAALTSNHRKSIRRERRDAQGCGLQFQTLRGADIKISHWDAFYRFYQSTIDRKWGSAYLTRAFFDLLSQKLGDRVVLMLALKDGEPVAGALNLIGSDTLYGRNWGCIGEWPFLHFELCYYRAIDFAIEHKLQHVEAGAQGEHKLQRGYLPMPTYSAHWFDHPGLRAAVDDFLVRERQGIKNEIVELASWSPFKASSCPYL